MTNLGTDFNLGRITRMDLHVPPLALAIRDRLAQITGADKICVAGGFLRGLYMQQVLDLTPQMNDVDVFANLSIDRFTAIRPDLEVAFGPPIRFHIGQFEAEPLPKGLIEFNLPESFRAACAGVHSLQLNFGPAYPWANPRAYLAQANLGINQIAMDENNNVIATPLFIKDMKLKTLTMNPDRCWSSANWDSTARAIRRLRTERPEFRNWTSVQVPRPQPPEAGTFWPEQKDNSPQLG